MGDNEVEETEPGPQTEDDIMKNELQCLQLTINKTTDDSLESTRRMLNMCEESKDAGIRTLVNLDEQGEQLDNFNEGMDEIARDMKEAEEALQGMEKCCGLCVLPWNKPKKLDDENADAWKKNDDGAVNSNGPRVQQGQQAMITGDYITKITNDEREVEMEKNMDEVSNIVGNLRHMANDMGNEIESQNRLLDTISAKAASNQVRIKAANQRANKLI